MDPSFYLVAGLGKTGQSIARYLKRRNQPFMVFDTRKTVDGLEEFQAQYPGIDVFLEHLPDTIYPQLKAVITSPGVAIEEPFLQQAIQCSIPVYGDIECLARELHAPVIAITGTNGKSTVTTLVSEMAKAAGQNVAMAGNIGTPVLDLLDDAANYDLWVLELSSFQLDLTHSLMPIAATLLNISPDHLDRHHSMAAYIEAKQRVYHNSGLLVYNRDDEKTFPTTTLVENQSLTSYGLGKPLSGEWGIVERNGVIYLACGERCILPVDKMLIKGRHNWQNALAACALAAAAGITQECMAAVLESFSGLPHRCQWVRTLDGVTWINDSKGTNIGATQSAISGIGGSMQGKIVLIAGGLGKGADFTELRQSVQDYVRSVVLFGTDADKIEQALSDLLPVSRVSSFEQAISLAKSQAKAGDVVLLSPACASLDMFRDFNHRGELFANLVNKL
ncbi:UDP-N-acetylmuramoyl-L-alanine--D-glutamate ligase [Legionella spiritensis]|uniref:UDP-N-acetylmuramoylalanine--D-glutamate ligase n=1 Tax=Legionella spiritensis TaxID=452 RepID=A0A0W0Z686_LEGSP|nr:UDP-N-acetylmuramoyl-L-alanine--D-glutamate ligase [Legionella spiritensis]KTD64642.1 UDP-N-acetylmuramoylalanine--D-glutamate ligase [Legionella spiritensis]SNV47564.1 UDP-N-acetylmuramoylalanine--D-glutamate ligase [Legionella spiritensis]